MLPTVWTEQLLYTLRAWAPFPLWMRSPHQLLRWQVLSTTSATLGIISNHRLHTLLLVTQMVMNLPAVQETWIQSLGQKDPLEKGMAPTPVFLFGEFHGQRTLVGYSSWGHKESDMTEQLLHTHRLYQEESLLDQATQPPLACFGLKDSNLTFVSLSWCSSLQLIHLIQFHIF